MKFKPNFFIYKIALALILFISFPMVVNANVSSSPPKLSFKEMRYSSDYIHVNIKIPMLSFRDNLNVEKRINNILEGDIISFKNQVESLSKESYDISKKESFTFVPYEAFEEYKLTYNSPTLLSLPVIFYTYTGGAHGNTLQQAYNFNLETGEKLTLNNIFIEGSNYKNIIKELIKSSIEKNPDIYFDDAISTVDKLNDSQSFYITKDNLIIYYGLYELAPYSSGIREFEIPLHSLSSQLNPKLNLIK